MSALQASTNLTPEEADLLPDAERFELYDGELREREMSGDSVWVAGSIFAALFDYTRANGGIAFTDGLALRIWPDRPGKLVRPDGCYFAPGRFEEDYVPTDGIVDLAPDVAVEVISPGDSAAAVVDKTTDYLEAGVRAVWVVYPTARLVQVHRPGRVVHLFPKNSTIEDLPELPGFRCDSATLFPKTRSR